jgi:hypothetical protein
MMARSTPEWIGKTVDTPVPPRVRLRVWDKHLGICQLSLTQIKTGEAWECHHVVGIEEGGENRENNLVPALVEPHKRETARQKALKKTINRQRKKHLGITAPKRKIRSAPFQSSGKQARITKTALPHKQLYQ